MLDICVENLSRTLRRMSGMMVGRLRFLLLELILREVGLLLHVLMTTHPLMMIFRMMIL